MTDWTIMVYMAGDNNLSADMVYALEQLKTVANGKKINLFVYYDGLSEDVPTLYCDFSYDPANPNRNTDIKLYPSYKVKNKLIDVTAAYNENSAAVNNIINFVDWCRNRTTVDETVEKKYAFIISGHTFGFVNKGLFKDEKSGYSMTYPRLKYMFERITDDAKTLNAKADAKEQEYLVRYNKNWDEKTHKERRTPILGKKLDLLGFDTCVMSTLEIACQFRKFADTMVASEGSIPTAGWNYAEILLENINSDSKTDSKTLAKSFVEKFIKKQNKFALADISVDISAWDLRQMNALEDNLAKLAADLLECLKDEKSAAFHQLKRSLVYAHWQCQTYLFEQHIDLGDFCKSLIKEIDLLKNEIADDVFAPISKIKESCQNVIESIQDCIILTGFSGSDFQFSNGISLFFPWSWDSYFVAKNDYTNLTFVKENKAGIKWNEFLEKFLSDVTFRPPNPVTKIEDINKTATAVVYKSYNLLEDESQTNSGGTNSGNSPKEGKQFPNSSKQFPNSSKQFPNSSRLDEFSIFLSRFMRLKNTQANWNWSGFTSKQIPFTTDSITTSDKPGVPPKVAIQAAIKIPIPETINRIDDFKLKFTLIEEKFAEEPSVKDFKEQINTFLESANVGQADKLLTGLLELNFVKSTEITEKNLKSDLQKALTLLNSQK